MKDQPKFPIIETAFQSNQDLLNEMYNDYFELHDHPEIDNKLENTPMTLELLDQLHSVFVPAPQGVDTWHAAYAGFNFGYIATELTGIPYNRFPVDDFIGNKAFMHPRDLPAVIDHEINAYFETSPTVDHITTSYVQRLSMEPRDKLIARTFAGIAFKMAELNLQDTIENIEPELFNNN